MTHNVVAIVQARMGSTRLPGKVMLPIANKPMLQHVIERLRASLVLNNIALTTTILKEDNYLEAFANLHGIVCYRGSVQDVLSQYYNAAIHLHATVIVRVNADSPLIDPRLVDELVVSHLYTNADYTSNGNGGIQTFPLGVDSEVFSYNALEKAYNESYKNYEREHVTTYIYQHPEIFKLKSVEAIGKLRRPDLRLTVDEEDDLRLVREIFDRLYCENQIFYTEDVIALLDGHPELISINAHVHQKKLGE